MAFIGICCAEDFLSGRLGAFIALKQEVSERSESVPQMLAKALKAQENLEKSKELLNNEMQHFGAKQ